MERIGEERMEMEEDEMEEVMEVEEDGDGRGVGGVG